MEPVLFTILIIEDDPDMIQFLSLLLHDKGNIISATSGEDGIALALSTRPDLILLDVELNGIDGFEVCRQLKARHITAAVPVLFVTAGDDEDDEVRALQLGAADFIAKPLRPAIVRARVDTQLALRRHFLYMDQLVHLDGLTGLFNRRFFDERLATEVARHRRQKQSLALVLIDVDHFKRFNDTLGHQQGDACLREIATALAACARRPGEVVARYGGEEFVIILPDCSSHGAMHFGERLCDAITALKIDHPHSVTPFVSISVGITCCKPTLGTTPHRLIELADRGLYQSKHNGRNQCSVTVEDCALT